MGSIWSIKEILQATKGKLLFYNPSFSIKKKSLEIQTDSRMNMKNKAFLALKGNFFDGHDFTHEAYKKGVKLLIIDSLSCLSQLGFKNSFQEPNLKIPSIIKVKNTTQSLTLLGGYCREKKLKKTKIIAITGSNGKTTTKRFAKTLLEKHFKTYMSPKSFNNHLGVPLSLLEAPPESKVIILEIGMNQKGEIQRLCHLAKPHICLVTNVGLAHRGHFKSQREIAKEKENLYSNAPKKAHFIFNYDNPFTYQMFEKFKKKKKNISFFSSQEKKANVFMKTHSVKWNSLEIEGHIQNIKGHARVPVFGKQNVFNLMGASALALKLGISPKSIWSSIYRCRTSWGRNEWIRLKNGAHVLFDAYNASPESVSILLKNILEIETKKKEDLKKKMAFFGEMMELGKKSEELHYRWGEEASLLDFKCLWFFGSHFKSFEKGFKKRLKKLRKKDSFKFYFTKDYSPKILKKILPILSDLNKNDLIFIKGSRAMKMERLLDELKKRA